MLLHPVTFYAAPRRLLPDFSSGQAKTHESSLISGHFRVLWFVPGRPQKNLSRPLFLYYGTTMILYDPRASNFAVLRKRGAPGLRVTSPQ